jgi:hypothetical protein
MNPKRKPPSDLVQPKYLPACVYVHGPWSEITPNPGSLSMLTLALMFVFRATPRRRKRLR